MSHRSDPTRRLAAIVLAVWIPLAPASVAAQPAPEETTHGDDAQVARAREAFRLGSALAREGQWTEALASFTRSNELRPHATTLYNMAFCERALGHFTRARKLFADAVERDRGAGGRELTPSISEQLRAYAAELDRRIARVVVTVEEPSVRVAVDGRPLEAASAGDRRAMVAGTRPPAAAEPVSAGTFELQVDPGPHVIVVTDRSGNHALQRSFESGKSAALSLGTRPLETRPAPPPDRTWSILAFGLGGAGLAVGSVAGIQALHEKSSLDSGCTAGKDRCEPRYQGAIDSMNRAATISTIAFGVGVVGVGVGLTLLLTQPSSDVRAEATLSPRGASLRGRF